MTIDYLTKADVLYVNHATIRAHGGHFIPPHNFLSEDRLDYLLEIVKSDAFGQPLYPQIHDKAAIYLYNIVANHVFQDGNKRTGLECCLLFLRLNGYNLASTVTNQALTEFVLGVAAGQYSLAEVGKWLEVRIIVI
jgi:death-on-curing protein